MPGQFQLVLAEDPGVFVEVADQPIPPRRFGAVDELERASDPQLANPTPLIYGGWRVVSVCLAMVLC